TTQSNGSAPDRNAIRSRILATRELKRKVISFFGEQIELRQRSLEAIFNDDVPEDPKRATVYALIQSAYIPGTTVRVVEVGDVDALLQMPYGQDFRDATEALGEISGINFPRPSDSSNENPSVGSSVVSDGSLD